MVQEYQRGVALGGFPLPLQVVLAMSRGPCLELSEFDERTWLGAVAGETAKRLPTDNRQQHDMKTGNSTFHLPE